MPLVKQGAKTKYLPQGHIYWCDWCHNRYKHVIAVVDGKWWKQCRGCKLWTDL